MGTKQRLGIGSVVVLLPFSVPNAQRNDGGKLPPDEGNLASASAKVAPGEV